jgi:pimeloyl-ACP methyl ester carboxylesterase
LTVVGALSTIAAARRALKRKAAMSQDSEMNRRAVVAAGVAAIGAAMASEYAFAAGPQITPSNAPPPPLKGLVRKAYADSTWGQIHYRYVKPAQPTNKTPVVFFHPNPFSGAYFNYTLEELGRDRMAIAFDTPGYGESATPPEPQTIEALAAAFALALENMGYGGKTGRKVDVSGFHTGAYIAPELAASRPDLVRRVVLSGVPFWEGELLESKSRTLLVDKPLTEDGAFAMLEWNSWAAHRNKFLPLERGHELFTQAVISGHKIWWAYYGVCKYSPRPRFSAITQPVLLIIPSGEEMQKTTRLAIPYLKHVKVIEAPQLQHQIFDLEVPSVGRLYREFLDTTA